MGGVVSTHSDKRNHSRATRICMTEDLWYLWEASLVHQGVPMPQLKTVALLFYLSDIQAEDSIVSKLNFIFRPMHYRLFSICNVQ